MRGRSTVGEMAMGPSEAEWVGPALVLTSHDAVVPVKMRTLSALASYALAGPSNDASTRNRDEAVAELHQAYIDAFRQQFPDAEYGSDPERTP